MAEISGGRMLAGKLAEMGVKLAKAQEVRVGFPEDAAYPDGTSVAMVAAINNFGAPEAGIPARPFFTDMVAAKSPGWGDAFAEILKDDDFDAAKALDHLGEGVIANQLREAINNFTGVPNSPVTDLLKWRFPTGNVTFTDVLQARRDVAAGKTAPPGKPLQWSDRMFHSVKSEVS